MSSNPWWPDASGQVASKGVAAEPDQYRQTLQCIFSFGFSTSYRFQRGRDVFVVGESFFSLTSGWLGLFFFFSCFVSFWRLRMNYHFFSGVSLFWRLTIGFFLKLPIPGWLLVAKSWLGQNPTQQPLGTVKQPYCWWFRNPAITSWGWQFIPLFTRFYTSKVVSRISEPTTVGSKGKVWLDVTQWWFTYRRHLETIIYTLLGKMSHVYLTYVFLCLVTACQR